MVFQNFISLNQLVKVRRVFILFCFFQIGKAVTPLLRQH